MATTESRGGVEAEILPPCQRDTGQLCLTELSCSGGGETRSEERKKRTSGQNPWKTAVTLDAGATIGSGCDVEIGEIGHAKNPIDQ